MEDSRRTKDNFKKAGKTPIGREKTRKTTPRREKKLVKILKERENKNCNRNKVY